MNPRTGVVLRLLGPSIEVACLLLLHRFGDRGVTLLGRPVETFLHAGIAAGLVLVVCGLVLVRPPRRAARGFDDERLR